MDTKGFPAQNLNPEMTKYVNFADRFEKEFGSKPDFICRAPGRVNLIGEHIDYCGYSVLPMAVSQDVSIAVKTNNEGTLKFKNVESGFEDYSNSVNTFVIDINNLKWFHYLLCGIKGIIEEKKLKNVKGMEMLVKGTVPKAAGMSSSSALVCAASLATSFSNQCELNKVQLAEICARCERYIGTQGGGMDQSISFLAQEGTAKLISFNPLKSESVVLPENCVFVISNSRVQINKAATSHYNIRVAECKISTQILAKHKSVEFMKVFNFSELQNLTKSSFEELLANVEEIFHKEEYSRKEICKILEINDTVLKEKLLSKNTENLASFKLYQRAKHVLSEANRVHLFKKACDLSGTESGGSDTLAQLGDLMNKSHDSCSNLYECSCKELDKLTQLCRDSGALGSRLTGAGWGGCAVSLVPLPNLSSFLASVKDGYYGDMDKNELGELLFASQPGIGAQVFVL